MSNLNLKTAGLKDCRITPPDYLIPYLKRWQSNNSIKNLGIVHFIFDLFYLNEQFNYPKLIKDFNPDFGVANWALKALLQTYTFEKGYTKEDRCFAIQTYRGGSKTFWFAFVSPVYDALVGQYGIYFHNNILPEVDYQVIRRKNSSEAKKALMGIASFFTKPLMTKLFGNLKPTYKQVKDKNAKDSANLLILSNSYIFECSSIDQPSRGLNLFQIRPKKIIFDDPQNRHNTKTVLRREQCDEEVMYESVNAVADDGMIIYIGNRISNDDTLSKLIDPTNTAWKKFQATLTVKPDGSPGVGNLDEEIPDWSSRYTIQDIKKKKEWFTVQPKLNGVRGWLKEFYNIIKSEANYDIKYANPVYFREYGVNWIKVNKDGKEIIENVNIYIGVDPAISKKIYSSNAVVVVIAVNHKGERYVLDYSSGKFDMFDKPFLEYKDNFNVLERNKIERVGTIGEIARKAHYYNVDGIGIESGVGVQEVFLQSTIDILHNQLHIFPTIMPIIPKQDKTEKLVQSPLAFFEIGLYNVRPSMSELIDEVSSFGEGSRKDILDAIYNAEAIMRIPDRIDYNPLGLPNKALEEEKKFEKFITKQAQKTSLLNDYESWIVY